MFVLKHPDKASALFENWQESMIWSCLQGVMGEIYVNTSEDSREDPVSAMAVLGDFCFLAGQPDQEMVLSSGTLQEFMIVVPQNEAWADLIEICLGRKARKIIRYAIKKEPGIFDDEKLRTIVNGMPEEYELQMIDEALFRRCREIEWCRDWVRQYPDYDMYQKYGLGAVILKDKKPVSGASSYSGYRGGIEIEIDTREDYRRRGLAGICGARLILECLKKGWYPCWDAHNKASVALAEKLGYHFDHEYVAYEISGRINDDSGCIGEKSVDIKK